MIKKVVSGGQTGVDRAGLDAAMEFGIPVGGYCPKGRLAEDGTVPEHYPLIELSRGGYPARTEKNVVESDGTLLLNIGRLSGGSKVTVECAKKHDKPYFVVQLDGEPRLEDVLRWIEAQEVKVFNVAGPRESKHPGVHLHALGYLRQIFKAMGERNS